MHFISDADVARVLTFPGLIAAMEAAHRRPKIEVLDGFLGSEGAQYVIRSAVDRGRYMASKMFTSFPGNLAAGKLPAVQAVCVLFDGRDWARPLAVSEPRNHALANRGHPGARRQVIGAGKYADATRRRARAHCAVSCARTAPRGHRSAASSFGIGGGTSAAALAASSAAKASRRKTTTDLDVATRSEVITTCTRARAADKGINFAPARISISSASLPPDTRGG